jgi:hypothetical protein
MKHKSSIAVVILILCTVAASVSAARDASAAQAARLSAIGIEVI